MTEFSENASQGNASQGYDKANVGDVTDAAQSGGIATEAAQDSGQTFGSEQQVAAGAMPLQDQNQQLGKEPPEPYLETASAGPSPDAINTGQGHAADLGQQDGQAMTHEEREEQRGAA